MRPGIVSPASLKYRHEEQVLADLVAAGLGAALFSDIRPNPVGANLEAGVAAYRAGRHDGVVAFSGGSGVDMGQLIAFMSGQTRPVWDFEDIGDWWTRADPAGIAPCVVLRSRSTPVARPVIHEQQLPAVKRLRYYAVDGLRDEMLSVQERHDDGHERGVA